MKILLAIIAAGSISFSAFAQKPAKLSSPDGSLQFIFRLSKTGPAYDVFYKGKPVVNGGELGVQFAGEQSFKTFLRQGKISVQEGVEKYTLVIGKTSAVQEPYREMVVPLEQTMQPFRHVSIVVRAFNDGIAFRYVFPPGKELKSGLLAAENTSFPMAGDPKVLALFLPNFTSSHEGPYSHLPLSQVKEDTLTDLPVLFELPGVFVAITEAALTDYAGMYLQKKNGVMKSRLSPLPDDTSAAVQLSLPHQSPWRVLMISDRVGALIESNLLTNLSPPNKIEDISWIKPGKTTWPWWNGNVIPDTIPGGNNFETNKYYIDFCARHHIEFHSVVEYGLHEWYVNDGANFQPGPHADPTRAVPGLDMQAVCDYAKEKGVGIRVWVHWAALYQKLDAAFAQYEKWGVRGLMIDFMDRDDQQMVNIQEEMLQKAAKHHLHVQFHGAYKPTGMSRTWPNEFTREGAMNYEYNKWGREVNPDHDINIPFTRMLAGSTDYHLGGFRAATPSSFRPSYARPLVMGTRCHMMAMYVVLENALGMVADYPDAYEGQPGFDWLKDIPTTWDETKVLDAKVGEYIVIARRKNNTWYVGAITCGQKRTISIPFWFLKEGKFTAEIFTDGNDPNQINTGTIPVSKDVSVDVNLAAGGGMTIKIITQ